MSSAAWANLIQTVALVVGAAALLFAAKQVRLARHGGGGANVLQLWTFLQSETARADGRTLYAAVARTGSSDPDAGNWTPAEVDAARHVCSTWSAAGLLARRDLVPADVLLEGWGANIARTWSVTADFVAWERARRQDPGLWHGFEWLAARAGER
ncbi:DUF4760 domain-containing protein [Geodermatophilus sabuli]|uniref:DUF4760 domain-containing protein n=1 Tax=Geodermatophilus sabuli TaxID=1564158 RepID=A0A285EBE0_9ACTN|nr:hypothetical protein [Geodermatophilus sabuli]MBB3085176.1 hypothetical protein [Geodermatophilus sabuli]SNX95416.1 hypothetical protein SAMN06893097_102112 [Geodermatophilus sabuli]